MKGYRKEQASAERGKRSRELITIFLLICTTGGVAWQIYEMIKVYGPIETQAVAVTNIFAANRQQQRAVVAFQPGPQLIIQEKDKDGATFAFTAQFQNFGGTRTSRFHAWTSVHYFDGAVPNSLDFGKPWSKVDVADIVIGPNSPLLLTPVSVTPEEAAKALKKEGMIIQWGAAEYSDIFEPDKIHTLNFCLLMQPANTPNGPATAFQPVPYQNDCNKND